MYTHYHPPNRVYAALERRVVERALYTTVACDSINLFGLGREDRRRRLIPNGVDLDDITRTSGPRRSRETISASPTSERSTERVMPGRCSTRCGRLWQKG